MNRRDLLIFGGSAVAWPHCLRAQQKQMPVIGFLSGTSPDSYAPFVAAFRDGLRKAGFNEGESVAIEYRWAEGQYERLPAFAADLVAHKVDVIVAIGGDVSALAAKRTTSSIPIVFANGADPVGDGLVANLGRPGGNVTGVTFIGTQLTPKQIELLSELVPQAKIIGLLVNPNNQNAERMIRDSQEAALAKGVQLPVLKASSESEIDAAFSTFGQMKAGGFVAGGDAYFTNRREQLVALSLRNALPVIYDLKEFAVAGGLISYGASIATAFRQLGGYAGKILKGAKPADLPVEQPTKFELVINLKTAKALGVTVPPSLLARADEVIE